MQTDAGMANALETPMRTEEQEDMRNKHQKKTKIDEEFVKLDQSGAQLKIS